MLVIKKMMILLTLWLSVNLAMCRKNLGDEEEEILHPVLRKFQKRQICQELCSSGLGGNSCGKDCVEIFQQKIYMQLSTSTDLTGNHVTKNVPRSDMCPVLCKYNLGKPLCVCSQVQNVVSSKAINFLEICSKFCIKHNYRISGCQKCSIYQQATLPRKSASALPDPNEIDWNAWCTVKCKENDGGAACDCDRSPMSD
ncbi:uncharacterized protein LOC126882951 [Diabrotica virgifera virgifera]|uniref:Uncharacterized protein n=1 Tax=Diabrotica virgifera virgifera TaxID=50390 RepID=A0ABM5K1C1_DIAVI|nr:uncharacterized protein LOC126882951 [Diabrotica virgifera virgifera]